MKKNVSKHGCHLNRHLQVFSLLHFFLCCNFSNKRMRRFAFSKYLPYINIMYSYKTLFPRGGKPSKQENLFIKVCTAYKTNIRFCATNNLLVSFFKLGLKWHKWAKRMNKIVSFQQKNYCFHWRILIS